MCEDVNIWFTKIIIQWAHEKSSQIKITPTIMVKILRLETLNGPNEALIHCWKNIQPLGWVFDTN